MWLFWFELQQRRSLEFFFCSVVFVYTCCIRLLLQWRHSHHRHLLQTRKLVLSYHSRWNRLGTWVGVCLFELTCVFVFVVSAVSSWWRIVMGWLLVSVVVALM